jgi:hypothetical protein
MFKLTTFVSIHPEKLEIALRGLHFNQTTKGFEWKLDGHTFLISPFGPKGNHQESYGYRIYFDGLIDGGLYLFEMCMSGYEPRIQAVEFDLIHKNRSQQDWIKDFLSRPSLLPGSMRGIFSKGKVGIVCLPDHTVNIQLRIKSKASKLSEFLKEIESVRYELQPSDFDLFSSFEEEVAV